MALFKISENYLRNICSIPFPSIGGNFAQHNVFRNKLYVELTCKSKLCNRQCFCMNADAEADAGLLIS